MPIDPECIDPKSVVQELMQTWSQKELYQGKSFDDIFIVDGVPLFWFFKKYFSKHILPSSLNTYPEAESRKKINFLRRVRLQASAMALRKYILFNEVRKIKSAVRKKKFTPNTKAIFLTYFDHLQDDNSLYRLQTIIDILTKDKKIEPFPLFVTQLSKSGIIRKRDDLNTIYQYYDSELDAKAREKGESISTEWKKIDQKILDQTMTLGNNIRLWPYLSSAFSLFMSKDFLYLIILYYEICKKILGEENAAILLLTTQNGLFDRCMIAAAKTKGIPCMHVSHGFATRYLTADNILDNMYFSLFNKTTEKIFIDRKVPLKRIRVTGPAVYDTIVQYKRVKHENASTRNILILTQPLIEDNQITSTEYFVMIKKIIEEIRKLKDVSIAIKLHPREKNIKTYQQICKSIDGSRTSVHQQGKADMLYSLLHQADVAINFNATAAILEASILDIPSITFSTEESYKYKGFDPAIYVKTIEALNPTIERLLRTPSLMRQERQKMVKEFCTVVDGKASERIVKWCYEILGL